MMRKNSSNTQNYSNHGSLTERSIPDETKVHKLRMKLKTLKSRSFKDEPISKYLYFGENSKAQSEQSASSWADTSFSSQPASHLQQSNSINEVPAENPFLRARRSIIQRDLQKILPAKKIIHEQEEHHFHQQLHERVTFKSMRQKFRAEQISLKGQ